MSDVINQLQRNREALSASQRESDARMTRRSTDSRVVAPGALFEAKVIARREATVFEEYDPSGLEAAINEELAGGWRLVGTESLSHAGSVAPRSTVLLFFERPVATTLP